MTQHENLAAAAEAAAAAAAAAAARSRTMTHPENITSSSRHFLAIILLQPIPRSSCPIFHFLLPLIKPPSSNRLLLLLPTRVGRLPLISNVLLLLPSQQNPCCCPPASTACPCRQCCASQRCCCCCLLLLPQPCALFSPCPSFYTFPPSLCAVLICPLLTFPFSSTSPVSGLMALHASRDADIQACRDFGVRVGSALESIGQELKNLVRYMGNRTFTSDRVHALLKSFKDGVCDCVDNDSTRRHLWQTCKEVLATPGWQVGFRV